MNRSELCYNSDMCGVFGAFLPCKTDDCDNSDAAKMSYFGLYALQHRGQESAGIATSNGETITVYKDLGLVSQVFNENVLASLKGYISVGHSRYSTTGSVKWENAQPTLGDSVFGTIALTHNGNLVNSPELRKIVQERYGEIDAGEIAKGNTTDTALITTLLQGNRLSKTRGTLFDQAKEILPLLKGAFSLVFMDEKKLYVARDEEGFRPLVIGTIGKNGYIVASENSALEIVGAKFLREVEPGELLQIDEDGIKSVRFAKENRAGCVFEYVYLARPDAYIYGQSVHGARVEMGRTLAKEHPIEADLVIPVPESGNPAAVGYAQQSKIPFAQGLTKNSYVGRTFIQPTDHLRKLGIRLKLNPLKDVIEGKRLVVVDDSIVRGNTQKALVGMLKDAGAKEVHVRISSPEVKYPCYYGIDFASPKELMANNLDVEGMCKDIGADSLGFISPDGMTQATNRPSSSLCKACFTGEYPINVQDKSGKLLLE
ncbi:amidophosphoribosyltransferase [Actinomycetota bacterium]|nr:amidophosphoribosyltransferase [Actinomycetota bacterium]